MKIQIVKKDSSKKFNFLAGINRAIRPAQVTRLAESLKKMGCLRPVVIAHLSFKELVGNYVIDGQHLFHALIRNNMDIPFVMIDVADEQDLVEKLALLNNSSKSWTLADYLQVWAWRSEEYKKLLKYYNTYDFEIGILASILSGRVDGGSLTQMIKRGKFKVVNEEQNKNLLDYLTDVLAIVPRMRRFENRYLCKEYVTFYRAMGSKYDHAKFLKKLSKNKLEFVLATQEPGKLVNLFTHLV